ncbi:hypothetical protein X766_09055 [Mesorhizobium sp. LSJC255A00]|nr:hypothetical protein X766_09055 [Mesorhizobium sp. LSJC255A00]
MLRLLRAGEYVNVLTSRQMGKSSLMVRTLYALREEGTRTASIDLAAELGGESDSDAWFKGLIGKLAREFGLRLDLAAWWREYADETAGQRLQRFFRDVACTQIPPPTPSVVFLDEIDSTLKHPFTDGLFTAIRGMYNERGLVAAYERVTFCLLGVATPNELIKDRRTTVYNVGRTLELRDFDPQRDDLHPLAAQLDANPVKGDDLLARVLYWTGGHPFLTVSLCVKVRSESINSPEAVDETVKDIFASLDQISSEQLSLHFQQILRFVELRLSHSLESLEIYRRVLKGERPPERLTVAYLELRLSGLVKRDSDGCLVVRNRIYGRLFDKRWLQAAHPSQVLGRYRRLAIAASVAVLFLLALSAYYIPGFYRQKSIAESLDKMASLRITVAGNSERGYTFVFPSQCIHTNFSDVVEKDCTKDQDVLESVLIDFPKPEMVRSIDLSKTKVSKADPLKRLTALKLLDLSGTQVSNAEPLKDLTKLTWLSLSSTRVSSAEPLKNLTALQTLKLSNIPVTSTAPLKGLIALMTLDLSCTHVSDTVPLEDLTKLLWLSLSSTHVSDIAPLTKLSELSTLDVSNTPVETLVPLYGLLNLHTVVTEGSKIPPTEAAHFTPRENSAARPDGRLGPIGTPRPCGVAQ